MLQTKFPSQSETVMTEMVLPNDTNNLGNLMGGNLLHWMDICSAMAAGKHANTIAVTAAVDNVSFQHPIARGAIVTLRSRVTRAFNTSMEVYIEVFSETMASQEKLLTNTAYYTFVALGENGLPCPVPAIEPETEEDRRRFEGALRRRELRLVLSGRLKPSDTPALQALFKVD
ncbi:MAG: acyl-CoA thioesterase [Bacteroidetes bacterium]|nr:acyl-CoA thioesterase [Bacteroidota bacterium]